MNGSIRIGNHTYSGQSYKGLVSLYALDMTITQFWRLSVISDDGSYLNTLGGTDASPIIVKGQYNEKEGTLSGEISVYGTDYPFTDKVKKPVFLLHSEKAALDSFGLLSLKI